MKIFHCVESYYPAIGGMQEVVKQLSERLVKLGHDVTVLTRFHPARNFSEFNGVKIESFKIDGNPKLASTDEEKRYVDFLLQIDCDVITFFAAQQWATDLALPVLKKLKAKKVSVPTGYSGLYWPEFKTYFEGMKTWIHDYDMNVYLSNDYRDINFARENNVAKIILIPNGAGEDEFSRDPRVDIRKKLGIPGDHFLILHVGSYTGWKGHKEAIEIFLRSKIERGTLLMIGNNHESFKIRFKNPGLMLKYFWNKISGRKRIICTFLSREETVAAYLQSDIFLFPSNIECSPIVLFECAAAKLPFLSTDVGNSREISSWTRGGEILPTEKDTQGFSHALIGDSVEKLNEFYSDKQKRARMAKEAHEIWKQKYSWEVIAKEYEQLYYNLIERK